MATVESVQRRRHSRKKTSSGVIRLQLKDRLGNARLVTADLIDQSEDGVRVSLIAALPIGVNVLVRGLATEGQSGGERQATVKWCSESLNSGFQAGLEYAFADSGNTSAPQQPHAATEELDLYEVMQLSPHADADTVARVYRILAQRWHPDSPTGNKEHFLRLCEAHRVLSDPQLRASYDARHRHAKQVHWEIFDRPELPSRQESEKRKRNAILEALYAKSLNDPERGSMNVMEFESLLGCPREHLEAALWYLRAKGHIKRADNGRHSITVSGFDVIESSSAEPHASLKMLEGGLRR